MKTVCCVCEYVISIDKREFYPDGTEKISHGLCKLCFKEEKKKAREAVNMLNKREENN